MDGSAIAIGVGWYVVFLFSTVCHEGAHAWAALRGGDSTAFDGGQVSLNPLPHVQREPIGMILLPIIFLVTYGWPLGYASAPYNAQWAYSHPKRAGYMALAGPAANMLIFIIAVLLLKLLDGNVTGSVTNVLSGGAVLSAITLLKMLIFLNLILALFNLLPLPPLDGNAVVMIFMQESTARKFMELMAQPMMPLIGIVIAWKVFPAMVGPIIDLVYRII